MNTYWNVPVFGLQAVVGEASVKHKIHHEWELMIMREQCSRSCFLWKSWDTEQLQAISSHDVYTKTSSIQT